MLGYLGNSVVSSFVRGNCRLPVNVKPITGFNRGFIILVT